MLSDGRRITAPLEKLHCDVCGLIRHAVPPSQSQIEAIFGRDYVLHTRLVNNAYENVRQSRYAEWIIDLLRERDVGSIFEVGAGTGSLMLELQRRSPTWTFKGVEPVAAAAAQAAAKLDIEVGLLRDVDVGQLHVNVVLSVNVIEHVHDPIAFLGLSRAALEEGGCVVIICPDGDRPTTELLIYDHIHSFTACAMEKIARRAGFDVVSRQTAPASLGAFHAFVLVPGEAPVKASPSIGELYRKRVILLERWQKLDELLLDRIGECSKLWAFGLGENAQLLRAYAPRVWERVGGFLADKSGFFDGQSITTYKSARLEAGSKILLAVRPDVQPDLAKRLEGDGAEVIRWDELIADDI